MSKPRPLTRAEQNTDSQIDELLRVFRTRVLEDFIVFLAAQIISARRITINDLVDQWEGIGLHHLVMQHVLPHTDDEEGDEYASSIDDFENRIIGRLEEELRPQPQRRSRRGQKPKARVHAAEAQEPPGDRQVAPARPQRP